MTATSVTIGRVLIVDDDLEISRLLRDVLIDLGYIVKNAVNGHDALRLVEIFVPDVVLLDISLPVMSGLDVLDRLRAEHPALRIIMLTGNSDPEVARATLTRGAFDYVAKPVELPVLERVVAAAAAEGPLSC